jgi:hypothetical protein
VHRIVDSIGSPATVSRGRRDYVTANLTGRGLYVPRFDSPEQPPNSAGSTTSTRPPSSSSPTGRTNATDLVAALRSEAGRNPHDRAFIDLVGELSTRSEANCI